MDDCTDTDRAKTKRVSGFAVAYCLASVQSRAVRCGRWQWQDREEKDQPRSHRKVELIVGLASALLVLLQAAAESPEPGDAAY